MIQKKTWESRQTPSGKKIYITIIPTRRCNSEIDKVRDSVSIRAFWVALKGKRLTGKNSHLEYVGRYLQQNFTKNATFHVIAFWNFEIKNTLGSAGGKKHMEITTFTNFLNCQDSFEACAWYSAPLKVAQVGRHLTIIDRKGSDCGTKQTSWILYIWRRTERERQLAQRQKGIKKATSVACCWTTHEIPINDLSFLEGHPQSGARHHTAMEGEDKSLIRLWECCQKNLIIKYSDSIEYLNGEESWSSWSYSKNPLCKALAL